MVCPSCKADIREGLHFCTKCGNPLCFVCAVCHAVALHGDVYCGQCGSHILVGSTSEDETVPTTAPSIASNGIKAPVAQSAQASDMGAERKTVTILFGDISGFTSMSEKLDPEDVTNIVNKCLSLMGEAVTTHEGYIDKFIGDCIMALFGAPITHENDPELAIKAAITMRDSIDTFNNELPVKLAKPLSLHIGINTGLVVAGKMGSESRLDYTVMGDTVNLASRLESKATNGQIFVSEYTYNQTKNLFEFAKHEPMEVKGKRDPVAVYEVLRALSEDEARSKKSSQIPLVGRNREMDMLFMCAKRLQDGEGQTLFLTSDPGFGKSRIQVELKKYFEHGEISFIEGHCYSYGKHTPYSVFIDIFKRLLAIDTNDTEESVEEKLISNLPLLLGENRDFLSNEARRAMVLVGKVIGADLSSRLDVQLSQMAPQEIQTETIRTIGWIFTIMTRRRPVVLSIEDIHNADTMSVEVASYLIQLTKESRLMLLLSLRPEKGSSASKLEPLARRILGDRAVVVTFERLTRAECELLVQKLLGSDKLPSELLELIGSRSGGNPLFIQEIVRSLIDEAVLKKNEDGSLQLLKDIATITIPSSITGLIIARVDQLQAELRDLLIIASVIGQSFSEKVFSSLVGDASKLGSQLAKLVEAELIFESQTFPDVEYSFHTTLIQEAVYDTILLKRRRTLHAQIAEVINGLYKESLQDYFESLAHHYAEADDTEHAYEFLLKSAYKAKASFANEIAAKFFERAIEFGGKIQTPNPPIAELQEAFSQVLELLGDMSRAILAWEYIRDSESEPLKKANALRNIGRILDKQGIKEQAISYYERSIELASNYPDSLEYGLTVMNYSWVLNRFKRTEEAIKKANEALGIFEKLSDQESIALCCNNLAVYHESLKEFDVALEFNNRSLAVFQKLHHLRQIGNVELSLGYLRTKRGEMELALAHFTRSAEAMDRIGNRVGSATALLAKGRCYADMGRHEEAEIALLTAIRQFREMQMDRRVVAAQESLVGVLIDQNKAEEALKQLQDALHSATANGFESDAARLHRHYGKALRLQGQTVEANEHFEAAIALFTKLGRQRDADEATKERDG